VKRKKKPAVARQVSIDPKVVLGHRHQLELEEEGVCGENYCERFPWMTELNDHIGNPWMHRHMADDLSRKGRIEVVPIGLIRDIGCRV
jgi:hypothetical protein